MAHELFHDRRMVWRLWAHVDHKPFEQLDRLPLENTAGNHAVVGVHVEVVDGKRRCRLRDYGFMLHAVRGESEALQTCGVGHARKVLAAWDGTRDRRPRPSAFSHWQRPLSGTRALASDAPQGWGRRGARRGAPAGAESPRPPLAAELWMPARSRRAGLKPRAGGRPCRSRAAGS